MLPNFLFPETKVQKDGDGPALALDDAAGRTLQLTLGIADMNEQSSLDVSVFGSADGNEWGPQPVVTFPQKFYKGVYTLVVDAGADVRHLKVKYKTGRWGHWTTPAEVTFYVFAEALAA